MKLDPVLIRVAFLTLESHRSAYDGTWPETVAAVTEWETREGFTTEYLQDQRGDCTPLSGGGWHMEEDKELAEQVLAALHKLASMTEAEAEAVAAHLPEVGMS
jgi:hypothetical protein